MSQIAGPTPNQFNSRSGEIINEGEENYEQTIEGEGQDKKQIYTYESEWNLYAINFSNRKQGDFRLALGSFIEDTQNKVEIIKLNDEKGEFERCTVFDHEYPPTKIMWIPDIEGNKPDLIATAGEYLRIWDAGNNTRSVSLKSKLQNSKQSEYCAPLTSFDWNQKDMNMIGTSSIDTTCTIWDVEKESVQTQLIAHDKAVYDICFSQDVSMFASAGEDGSVRHFDLRDLEHSTIIFESEDQSPLLRVSWNKQDPNYLATIQMDSKNVIILDIRVPMLPVAQLVGHKNCVNSIAWAPHSCCHICSAGDDSQALIWDLTSIPHPIEDPILAYQAEAEINMLQWSLAHTDWVAIAFDKKLQILRV